MRKEKIVIPVCVLFFCGCLTIQEVADIGDTRAESARSAPAEQEAVGLIFDWNRRDFPLGGASVAANTPYNSGCGGIWYAARGNPISVSNDSAFRMGGGVVNNRLMIGIGDKAGAGSPVDHNLPTSAARHVPGQFNFSQGTFRLTVDYKDPVYVADTMFRFAINNNRDEQERSILGAASNVREYQTLDELRNGIGTVADKPGVTDKAEPAGLSSERIIITFTPSILYEGNAGASSLANAFFTIFTWTNQITITGIKLERVE